MIDLGNMSLSPSVVLTRCPSFLPVASEMESAKSIHSNGNCNGALRPSLPPSEEEEVRSTNNGSNGTSAFIGTKKVINLEDDSGVSSVSKCFLPFLGVTKKMVRCLVCRKLVYPGEELACTIRGCQGVYHLLCAKKTNGLSKSGKFKCPQHECFVCDKKPQWQCVRCPMAAHDKHAPWPAKIIQMKNQPGNQPEKEPVKAVCWRHPTDWRLDTKSEMKATRLQEVFSQMPLPYFEEEFKVDFTWNPVAEEPVVEDPVAKEPVLEDPVAEEPVLEDLIAEDPVLEDPVAKEPVLEDLIAEDPVVKDHVAKEPVVKDPVEKDRVEATRIQEVFSRMPLPYFEEEFKVDFTWYPVAEDPAVEDLIAEDTVAKEPVLEDVLAEDTVMEDPVANEPVVEDLIAEDPVVKDHVAKKHVVKDPVEKARVEVTRILEVFSQMPLPYFEEEFKVDFTWNPVAEEPVVEDPVAKEPVLEDPVAEKPVLEDLIAEDPILEDPVAKEPVLEDLIAKDPVVKDHVAKEHVVKDPVEKARVEATRIQEVFSQMPLPDFEEEFKVDFTWNPVVEDLIAEDPVVEDLIAEDVMPPYVHIRRNIYHVQKRRDDSYDDIGCTNCGPICCVTCVCRYQCISCSKACGCPETCSNRPFQKEKKIKIVKTELCGWGVDAAESINKKDFIIEYVGEVINELQCERRLWDMKHKGTTNFYLCEIQKDFTIDATFKGNASRFLNHSCDPNCFLEKWLVEGEIRIGVFAARKIEAGEALTYNYRFVQFGAEVKCNCGSEKCKGYLGSKKKERIVSWGAKREPTGVKRRRRVYNSPSSDRL